MTQLKTSIYLHCSSTLNGLHLAPVTVRIDVDFDKMRKFYDKYVFIVIKIKYVNFDNINNIYDKLNFIIYYTQFITTNINFIKKYTHRIMFYTHDGTVHSGTLEFPTLYLVQILKELVFIPSIVTFFIKT